MALEKIIADLGKVIASVFIPTKSLTIPPPLILASKNREGLSAIKSAQNVLSAKKELGLPTGDYADGTANYDDIMIYLIIKEVYRALQEDARIPVSIQLGTSVTAAGTDATGTPVTVQGATTSVGIGNAIIQ